MRLGLGLDGGSNVKAIRVRVRVRVRGRAKARARARVDVRVSAFWQSIGTPVCDVSRGGGRYLGVRVWVRIRITVKIMLRREGGGAAQL